MINFLIYIYIIYLIYDKTYKLIILLLIFLNKFKKNLLATNIIKKINCFIII